MKKQNFPWLRILRRLVVFVGVVMILLYIGLPVGVGIAAVLPLRAAVGSPPQGYEVVTLPTQDKSQLTGWYYPPVNGSVILLLHGAGGWRQGMLGYAEMLVQHDYGVLILDLRGHGESQGTTNRLGWQGTFDVGAAVAFLESKSEVRNIGGLGNSMGGEVLLGAASTYPALQAIVADGATCRCLSEYLALEKNRPLVRNFTARVMYSTVQLLTGDNPPFPLLDSMREAETTSFLLIAAGNDTLETEFNQFFAKTLSSRAQLWIAPGVDHVGASARYPEDYEQRVLDFFQSSLMD